MKEGNDITSVQQPTFNFRKYAWKQFKKNKPALISLYALCVLAVIGVFASILANDQPLYCKYRGKTFFPAFTFAKYDSTKNPVTGEWERLQFDIAEWKKMDLEKVIWAPVAYSPSTSDLMNHSYVSPLDEQKFRDRKGKIIPLPRRFKHWIGTSKRGEDVLSGLIHGVRISLTIGILSMGIASILGVFLGALAGYFGDSTLKTTRGSFWTFIIGVVIAFYYGFMVRGFQIGDALGTSYIKFFLQLLLSLGIMGIILLLFYYLGKLIGKIPRLNKKTSIPVDSIVSRTIEILISLPRLILIISIAAIAKSSIVMVMIIIGLTSWTEIARFTRAEFLRVRGLDYIQAAKALGYSEFRTIFRHALPNSLAPVFVAIAFGIAAAILIESALSFLGVGVPADTVTWGSLLFAGKEYFNAWWLVVFPGLAIFITVTVYNLLGEGLRDALDPRLKQ